MNKQTAWVIMRDDGKFCCDYSMFQGHFFVYDKELYKNRIFFNDKQSCQAYCDWNKHRFFGGERPVQIEIKVVEDEKQI